MSSAAWTLSRSSCDGAPPQAGSDRTRSSAPADRDESLRLLASLSGTLGLLEIMDDGLLRPLDVLPTLHHPSDLETVLKYPGKTNEQFTALMINLAAALSTRRRGLLDGTLRLLDPMCGRGTTLNRALRLGLSPRRAEIDRKDVEAYRAFLSSWLRGHRYKHSLDTGRLAVQGRSWAPGSMRSSRRTGRRSGKAAPRP